jgi:hypothetical protein
MEELTVKCIHAFCAVSLLLLASTGAYAQSYSLNWFTIDGGGLQAADGGGFKLSGTAGQPDAGAVAMTGAGFKLTGGFWAISFATPGDLNCDGLINTFDIDPFVLALVDPTGYASTYPNCDIMSGDVNGDGLINVFDIDPFVECIIHNGCP